MTKAELIKENQALKEAQKELESKVQFLQYQFDQLVKLVRGGKSERFKYLQDLPPDQLNLFGESNSVQESIEQPTQTIHYERKASKKHNGRNAIPDHLPVEEIIIEPDEDTKGMKLMGQEITETLEFTEASLKRKRYIRNKYAKADGNGVVIGALPSRPINKAIAEASLLAYILVCKFITHLPFYRQIQMFKRDFGWEVSSSTLNDWMAACCELMKPLYDKLKEKLLESDYIQADESPIKVLDKDKKGTTHQGYQWVYHAPEHGLVLFNYRKGRGQHGPKELLSDYAGYVQCDGYKVYDKIARLNPKITLVGCLAHARRKFFEAKDSDGQRAEYALGLFRQIYMIERKIQDQPDISLEQIGQFRQERIKPLMEELKKWVETESAKVLPKSPMGKAMNYYQAQWSKLNRIFLNPKIKLDNNLIENTIRPLALGRKNYLFGGSHKGAERIAMMYSFFATCKAHDVNPREWLKDVLEKLPDYPVSQVKDLLPEEWKKSKELSEV